MVKRAFLLVGLFAFVFLASGCITIYTDGACSAPCTKKVVKAQTEKGPNIVKQADDWVKENIW